MRLMTLHCVFIKKNKERHRITAETIAKMIIEEKIIENHKG